MSDSQRDRHDHLQAAPEARREAVRGLARLIARALAQADAIGCDRAAIYLAAARDMAETAAEWDGFIGDLN